MQFRIGMWGRQSPADWVRGTAQFAVGLSLCMGSVVGQGNESAPAGKAVEASPMEAPKQLAASVQKEKHAPFLVERRYHSLDEIERLFEKWDRDGGSGVRSFLMGGMVPAIELGGGDTEKKPLAQRRTVLLVGGMDGRSVAGGEAVLQSVTALWNKLGDLRDDISIVAVPWATPKILSQTDLGSPWLGEDLDGDGLVLEMLIEDPVGSWTRSLDSRFLVEALSGDAPRYRRMVEGQSEGELRLDHVPDGAFAVRSEGHDPLGSAADPFVRELKQFILSRPMAGVCVFQGNHGGLAVPSGVFESGRGSSLDRSTFETIGKALRHCTQRSEYLVQDLHTARPESASGSFVEWCYSVPGVLAFEVAPWGACMQAEALAEQREPEQAFDPWDRRRQPGKDAQNWVHWLDDVNGGLGFVEWRPIERGPGSLACLVGGWQPKTFHNPPVEALPECLQGLDQFVVQWVDRQPRVELCDVAIVRDGDLCTVRARLRCSEGLPLVPESFGHWSGDQVAPLPWMRMIAPSSIHSLAGPTGHVFGNLDPGAKTNKLEWLLFAPLGTRVQIEFGVAGATLGVEELTL